MPPAKEISLALTLDEWVQITILLRECAFRQPFPGKHPLTVLEDKIRNGIREHAGFPPLPTTKRPYPVENT